MTSSNEMLTELMESYGAAVWGYIYSQVKDVHLAQDLTQEVFMKVYQSIAQFRGQSSIKTWLFTIAHNKCKDYFRSALFRRVIPVAEPETNATSSSLEEDIVKHLQYYRVLQDLFQLDRKYREVMLLRLHEGMTFAQISKISGVAIATVKTRYRRALQVLRQQVEKDGEQV